MRSFLGLSALSVLATASPMLSVETIHNDAAPVLASSNAQSIPDNYIVIFKDHVTKAHAEKHHSWVQSVHQEAANMDLKKRSQFPLFDQVYAGLKNTFHISDDFKGYSGHFDEQTLEQIRRHPDVEYIEVDQEVHTLAESDEPSVQKDAPWGLARISHRDSLGFSTFNKYLYTETAGEGVDVYVIDTGTNIEHVDFEGRAKWGKTIPAGDEDKDGNGHGTHCSGTVAGKKYGVAKSANIRAVKVLKSNGSGTMSDVVSGVEYAVKAHKEQVEEAKKGNRKGFKGSAANMSLGGGKSVALDRAVNAAVDAGIHFAVAAGNDNANSCNYSPAAADKAVTVGASNFQEERAYFSNYGKCNDIFAPGLNILSTWIGGKTATNTISGTSMASPHIAGLLAYYLSLQPASDSAYAVAPLEPAKLKAALISVATKGALDDVPSDTDNLLAWNGGGNGNFSDIIHKGGYTVTSKKEFELPSFEKIEDTVSKKTVQYEELIADEVRDITHKVEDMVAKELRGFFREMHA